MRLLLSMVAGAVVALLLFLLMQSLVAGGGQFEREEVKTRLVDFVRVRQEEITNVKERRLPRQPPAQKPPPPPPRLNVPRQEQPQQQQLSIDTPEIRISPATGSGPYLGVFTPGDPAAEGDIIPIVRIQPQYPREALLGGIEGWVEVEFTIAEDGSVKDPVVVNAEPRRMFNREAVRAILRWKFKPRVVEGVAVERRARQIIEFKLDRGT